MGVILIPFSGGLDSTSILYNAMRNKERINITYIEISNNTVKTPVEVAQCKKIISLLNNEFSGYNLYFSASLVFGSNVSSPELALKQPIIWLAGILYALRGDETEVRLGFCMNDDAISYVEEIKKIWNSFQGLYDVKLPELTFPLMKSKKDMHYRELPNIIFQETYFCESPIDATNGEDSWKDCGECGSCTRSKNDGIFFRYNRNNDRAETRKSSQLELDLLNQGDLEKAPELKKFTELKDPTNLEEV